MNNAEVFVEALFELVFEHAHNDRVMREVHQRGLLTDDVILDEVTPRQLTVSVTAAPRLPDSYILEECKNRDLFTVAHADDVNLLAECIRRGIRPPQSDREIIDELVKRGIKPLVVTWGDVSEYLNHADHKELRDTLQLIVTRL